MLVIDKAIILKQTEIFSELPEDKIIDLSAALDEIDYKQHDVIIKKNDFGRSMYIVVEGEIEVIKNDNTVFKMHSGDIVGELSALVPEPRSATVKALTNCRLFRIEEEDLYDMMQDNVDVARGIIQVLVARLRENKN